jgi:HSP20 family molecular chaperone IbpA
MKRDANSPASNSRHSRVDRPASPRRRKCIVLGDLTDCLLQAYECVARRAYEKYLDRGGKPGGELEDWLSAEHELLHPITVDFDESDEYVHALASSPCFANAEVDVSIEPRWLAILAEVAPADGFTNRAGSPPSGTAAAGESSSQPGDAAASSQAFCVVQLPAEVVPKASIAILGDGVIGIRMPKAVRPVKPVPVESPANLAVR